MKNNNNGNKEWAHFIGKRYTEKSFLNEAEEFSVTRNLPASQLKGMAFGDIVNLMQWDGKEASLFAQFTVSRILIRDSEISSKVFQKLLEEGRAQVSSGGSKVVTRECGSYEIGGSAALDEDVSIIELVDMAEELAKEAGKKIQFMVGGNISAVLPNPVPLGMAGPKFSRGFIKYSTGVAFQAKDQKAEVVSVNNYRSSGDE